ncbi:MAG: phage tail protein [Armatimonadota bacterium]
MTTLTQLRRDMFSFSGTSDAEMAGMRATLEPNLLQIALMPREDPVQKGSLWHRVEPPRGMTVKVTSTADEVRIVRLTVESKTPQWNPEWPQWFYAVRRAPELIGGHAIDAQDVLADDAHSLTLLVLPGETREATLEAAAFLDEYTMSGHYDCNVRITDVTDGEGESCLLHGDLELQHPPSRALGMLPAIYTDALDRLEEEAGDGQAPFFARFLRGFDDGLEPLEHLIPVLHRYFGPYSTPGDLLPWLSCWVALALNENWSEMRRRRLIAEAVELYRWRGTRKGLSRYLEIYAGVQPEINDQPFHGWRLGADALLGQNTVLGDVAEHTFVVTLAVPDPSAVNEQIVRDIIESEKPAHTGYTLRIVRRISFEEERAAK